MTPDAASDFPHSGADAFAEMLDRPWDCQALHMELQTAIGLHDGAGCRELLKAKGQWLAMFKGHEQAELMDAAIRAEAAAEELVGLLLRAGVPAHCVYDKIGPDYQHTPLVTAARLGRLDLVRQLVAAGADLFWASPSGANALSEILPSRTRQAPMSDSAGVARVREWLTGEGLRIDPLCADSRRKLLWASSGPASWPDVPALLAMGIPAAVTGWSPFMFGLAMGTAGAGEVAALEPAEFARRDAMHRTPFLLAVQAGNLEAAQALLDRGSDLHARGHCGATALHLAADEDGCRLLTWLLEAGIPVTAENEFGNSALHAAVGSNRVEAARLLLERGADVKERDGNGYGLVHQISITDDLTMLELLLQAGANVNDVSGGGCWPLQDACHAGNAVATAYLLAAGADPDLTSTGETALFAAVSGDSLECVRLLVEAGAAVNATDCDGWTCLFHLRSEPVARYLLQHGADPGTPDQCGGLPEDWGRVPLAVRQLLRDSRTARPSPNPRSRPAQ